MTVTATARQWSYYIPITPKLLALAATEAYQTAKKFVIQIRMSGEQRERLALKIGIVTR
jgi:hypothetical protein